jgi:hypothetical protein
MLSFKQLRKLMQVQGNGILAVREQSVSSFTRLHLSVRGTVELVQGDEEKVLIEGDDNLLDYLLVTNAGRTLYVTTEDKLRSPAYTQLRVRVYLRQLDQLDVAGQGDVHCATALVVPGPLTVKVQSEGNTDLHLETGVLTLNAACQGRLTLRGTVGEANIKTTSQGDLDASELRAGQLKLRNMSEGNVELFATDTIAIQHLGQGYVHYAGPARLTDVRQYGEGEVKHVG